MLESFLQELLFNEGLRDTTEVYKFFMPSEEQYGFFFDKLSSDTRQKLAARREFLARGKQEKESDSKKDKKKEKEKEKEKSKKQDPGSPRGQEDETKPETKSDARSDTKLKLVSC